MADAVKNTVNCWIERLDERLHDKNLWFSAQMDQLEQKTGVKRVHVALGESPTSHHSGGSLGFFTAGCIAYS